MSWALISDSSCNLRDWQPTAPHTTFAFAPLKIRVGEREFVDDLSLDVHELNCAVQAETNASSSACPSVGEWAELFKLADKTICMPISEGVSGSYNAAATARDMVLAEEPDRQIHLVNSRAAGGKMDLIFLLFDRYLAEQSWMSHSRTLAHTSIALSRTAKSSSACAITKTSPKPDVSLRQPASLPTSSISVILGTASEAGKIELVGHTRGEKKMLNKIIDTMEAEGFTGGEVVIDHVENEAGAQALAEPHCRALARLQDHHHALQRPGFLLRRDARPHHRLRHGRGFGPIKSNQAKKRAGQSDSWLFVPPVLYVG